MYGSIKGGWAESSKQLAESDDFWERSAAGVGLLREMRRAVKTHATGRLLDVGAGTLCCRRVVQPYIAEYRSLDFRPTHPELDYVADAQKMPLPDNSFDTTLSSQVLEHVPNPEQALREMYRVLKPGGKTIITIPLFGYLHNEPHDYFRYTKYGVQALMERTGFTIIEIKAVGSFLSFLHYMFSTVLIALTFNLPLVGRIIFELNRWLGKGIVWLDRIIDRRGLFALNYVAVGQKPAT
jgi:SAM-dependent methyltransferase